MSNNSLLIFNLGNLISKSWEDKSYQKDMSMYEDKSYMSTSPRVTDSSSIINGKLCGKCHRQIFIRLFKLAQPSATNVYGLRRMDLGCHIENNDQTILKEIGLLTEENENRKFSFKNPLDEEQEIKGEIDTLIKIPTVDMLPTYYSIQELTVGDNAHIIVEHKTGGGYQFEKETYGSKTKGGKPKEIYLMQLAIYIDQFPKVTGIEVPYGKLYYVDRESGYTKEFDVWIHKKSGQIYVAEHPSLKSEQNFVPSFQPYYDLKIQNIYERYAILNQYIKNKELPPRDYRVKYSAAEAAMEIEKGNVPKYKAEAYKSGKNTVLKDDECEYCPYYNFCIKTDKLKIEPNAKESSNDIQ